MRPPIVILAGGFGTRLYPVTKDLIPKVMVDVFGKPFLYWLISHYISQGFTDITVSTGHLREIIEAYPWDSPLRFVADISPGTQESFYCPSLGTRRWVVNGDTYIPESLPYTDRRTLLTCNDVDAGAHLISHGKTHVHKTQVFYDIGTPEGLERFKQYFGSINKTY